MLSFNYIHVKHLFSKLCFYEHFSVFWCEEYSGEFCVGVLDVVCYSVKLNYIMQGNVRRLCFQEA